MFIRAALLAAMCTLLVVEGNFLAEWLFASRITPSASIQDYTMVSYAAFGTFLAVGVYLRWKLLQRLRTVHREERSASPAGLAD